MFFHKLKGFLKKDFLLAKKDFIDCIVNFLMTLLFIGIFFFISKIIDRSSISFSQQNGSSYLSFVFIGMIFIWYFSLILDNTSRSIREYWLTGILEVILATPTRLFTLLLGINLWNVLFATLQIIILLLFGRYALGVEINTSNILLILFILTLTIFICISFGFISTAMSLLFFKKRDPVVFLINCSAFLLCGAYFPINLLPGSLQKISYILPMTYALRGLRSLLLGGSSPRFLFSDLVILAVSFTLLFPASVAVFRYALRRARIKGMLSCC